jgi:hypothetical protein
VQNLRQKEWKEKLNILMSEIAIYSSEIPFYIDWHLKKTFVQQDNQHKKVSTSFPKHFVEV